MIFPARCANRTIPRQNDVTRASPKHSGRRFTGRWTMGDLVRFHTARKLTLLAHVPEAYLRLGQLVAGGKSLPRADLQTRYSTEFMKTLRTVATPRRHGNVLRHMPLRHMLGYLKHTLEHGDRAELLTLIQTYAAGQMPLIVPMTVFAHHLRRHNVSYLPDEPP
jgi:uncharacterized protein YbgA (DUF1722 family)